MKESVKINNINYKTGMLLQSWRLSGVSNRMKERETSFDLRMDNEDFWRQVCWFWTLETQKEEVGKSAALTILGSDAPSSENVLRNM